jgi:carboxylesterase type B
MWRKVLLALATLSQAKDLLADIVLQLPNGQIRGREAVTLENRTFFAFEGVPYAAPPIGPLRFKAPQPPENWDDVLDTTHVEVVCFQTSSNNDNESEDCLYVNVYGPALETDYLPVMVFIHGGGFVDGASYGFQPDLFINHEVMLVTINYRLGAFGFLSTQDEIIPGNNGLKDQQLALQWIQDNIYLFGGDPGKVTIFGQSAGSASCAYQLLNQKSVDLFQGAILESGTFLSPWAFQRRAREIAFTTAAFLNSTFETSDDSQALLEFLQSVDARDLDAAAEKYHNMEYSFEDVEILQGFYWAPVVEVKNEDAFITKNMYGLLQAGNVVKVPTLLGITSEENLVFNSDPATLQSMAEAFDQQLDWVVPNDMQISDQTNRTDMGRMIRELYTSGEPFADHLGDTVRFTSDTSFTRSVIKHAELYSQFAETYFYIFSYDGALGHGNVHYDGAESVGHSEDTYYLFCSGQDCDASGYPEQDQVIRDRLLMIWTDFAKYQNPTPTTSELLQNITWPVVSTEEGDFYYVDIGENLEIKNHPKEETYKGWNSLYESLDFNDFDTY